MPEPNVTVIRPELTEDERAERQQKVEKCIADFWRAMERRSRDEKGEIRKDAESV